MYLNPQSGDTWRPRKVVAPYPLYAVANSIPDWFDAAGLGGLGSQQVHNTITTGIQTGLTTAALYDPEPISKALLAVAAGMTAAVSALFSGCGQTCTLTSEKANQVESLLKQNLSVYLATPTPRYRSLQQQALSNFDQLWAGLVQYCGQIGGQGGANCVADRQAGACKWKSGGECWNWFIGYRDPIANDSSVIVDPTIGDSFSTVGDSVSSLFGGTGGNNGVPLLLVVGLAALAIGVSK